MIESLVTLAEIRSAAIQIAPFVAPTPTVRMYPSGLALKAESLHPTGAFKLRGAFHAILALSDAERRRGVVAHSSGNHAQAVAFAANRLGVAATVVMPRDAPRVKREATRRWGATVVEVGPASDDRTRKARELSEQQGLAPIEPYDSRAIIAATGTIMLEIFDQMPAVSHVYAPMSGGGLMAGIAAAAKLVRPDIVVVGCEPELAADAVASLAADRIVRFSGQQMARTCADGLRVQQLGELNWPHVRQYVDATRTVREDEISAAVAQIAAEARLVAEPSGAVSVAAALKDGPHRDACAILTGGNVDQDQLAAMLLGASNR